MNNSIINNNNKDSTSIGELRSARSMTKTTSTTTTVVSIGRRITNVENESESVVEVLAWMRDSGADVRDRPPQSSPDRLPFPDRRVVRLYGPDSNFYALEIGGIQKDTAAAAARGTTYTANATPTATTTTAAVTIEPKLFVNYDRSSTNNNILRHDRNFHGEERVRQQNTECGSSCLAIYPFVPYPQKNTEEEAESQGKHQKQQHTASLVGDVGDDVDGEEDAAAIARQYFPKPELAWDCGENVTAMVSCCGYGSYNMTDPMTKTGLETTTLPRLSPLSATASGNAQITTTTAATTTISKVVDLLLVGTARGNLQVWKLDTASCMSSKDNSTSKFVRSSLLETIHVRREVVKAFNKFGNVPHDSLPANAKTLPPIEAFYIPPKHLTIDTGGFVTHHYNPMIGHTLLLWEKRTVTTPQEQEQVIIAKDDTSSFQVVTLINLPVANRYPKFHYDGRRLIVLGQDHIGALILVYRVWNSDYDIDDDDDDDDEDIDDSTGENIEQHSSGYRIAADDGGVFHLGIIGSSNDRVPCCKIAADDGGVFHLGIIGSSYDRMPCCTAQAAPRKHIRLANTIRHAALGGFQLRLDDLYMTCNERFIIVNTKSGNLLNDSDTDTTACTEGLLVIDLDDHET